MLLEDRFDFREAARDNRNSDQFPIDRGLPWTTRLEGWPKSATAEAETLNFRAILYNAAESIRILTALLYPFLPYATAKVWAQLGLGDIEQAAKNGTLKNLKWGDLEPGTKLGPLSPIFPRAPKELIQTHDRHGKPHHPKTRSTCTPHTGSRTHDDSSSRNRSRVLPHHHHRRLRQNRPTRSPHPRSRAHPQGRQTPPASKSTSATKPARSSTA